MVYGYDTRKKHIFIPGRQYNTEFQAEVYAIKAADNTGKGYKNRNIHILSIETSIFYQTVRKQLKHLTITRSILNGSGTAISPL
jgi:hypothetical protein